MRANTIATAAVLGLICTALPVFANTASFAGYIQASSAQDFALLSSSIGDSSFSVNFNSNGGIGFSYFAGAGHESATLNLIDATTMGTEMRVMGVLAGSFDVTTTNGPDITGNLFVLPPADYGFSNIPDSVAQVVPGESVVHISSLVPVVMYPGGCPYCGLAPFFGGSWSYSNFDSGAFAEAPEPGTFALFGLALAGAGIWRKRQYFKPKP